MSIQRQEVWVVELDDEPEEAFCGPTSEHAKLKAQEAAEEFHGSQFKVRVTQYVPVAPRKRKAAKRSSVKRD